jgi:hypothetical protein
MKPSMQGLGGQKNDLFHNFTYVRKKFRDLALAISSAADSATTPTRDMPRHNTLQNM